jgi:hypothetical protein
VYLGILPSSSPSIILPSYLIFFALFNIICKENNTKETEYNMQQAEKIIGREN